MFFRAHDPICLEINHECMIPFIDKKIRRTLNHPSIIWIVKSDFALSLPSFYKLFIDIG